MKKSPKQRRGNDASANDNDIDYLSGGSVEQIVPAATRGADVSFVLLGYDIADWSLRVLLKRVWGARIPAKSWAVQPDAAEFQELLWNECGVDLVIGRSTGSPLSSSGASVWGNERDRVTPAGPRRTGQAVTRPLRTSSELLHEEVRRCSSAVAVNGTSSWGTCGLSGLRCSTPRAGGESSLLRAGVAARLRQLAGESLAGAGAAPDVPVVFSAWKDDPTQELIDEILAATNALLGEHHSQLDLPRDP